MQLDESDRQVKHQKRSLRERLRGLLVRPNTASAQKQTNFLLVGQSNIGQWFTAADGKPVEDFIRHYLSQHPENEAVQLFDAAKGGSALLKQSAQMNAVDFEDDVELCRRVQDNYWFDEISEKFGPAFLKAERSIQKWRGQGIAFDGIIWSQGEADAIHLREELAETYCNTLPKVFQRLIWRSGAKALYIQEIGRIDPVTSATISGVDCVRKAQRMQAQHDPRVHIISTTFDLPLRDPVHLTNDGYREAAKRMAIGIATGETSPTIDRGFIDSQGVIHLRLALGAGQALKPDPSANAFQLRGAGQDQSVADIRLSGDDEILITPEGNADSYQVDYAIGERLAEIDPSDLLLVEGKARSVPVRPFRIAVT